MVGQTWAMGLKGRGSRMEWSHLGAPMGCDEPGPDASIGMWLW